MPPAVPHTAPPPEPEDARAPGWTGGQWSLVRAVFAIGLVGAWVHPYFVRGGEPSTLAIVLTPVAVTSSAFLLVGAATRQTAAVATATTTALIVGLGEADTVAFLALLLVGTTLILTRPDPFGSWTARGRPDPRGGWTLPAFLPGALRWVLAALYVVDGGTQIALPSEQGSALLGGIATALPEAAALPLSAALFTAAVLLLIPATAPWTSALLIVAQAVETFFSPRAGGQGLVAALHLAAAAPGWIPPLRAAGVERVFYDGACGLCHRSVRFLLSEDPDGVLFRFAALQGETIREALPEEKRRALPDSIVLLTADGRLLVKSSAVAHALRRLGGLWRPLGWLLTAIPRPLRDLGYDGVATVRHRIFPKPPDACPIIAPELRPRFLP